MVTFDFDEVTSFSIPAGSSNTFTETEGGVTFTFSVSVQAAGGAVLANDFLDALAATTSGPSFGPPVWTLTFDGSGASDSQFRGFALNPIEIGFGNLGGSGVDVTFLNSVNPSQNLQIASFVGTNLQAVGQFTGIRFTSNDPDYLVTSLKVGAVNCFCRDTRIQTLDGLKPVQDLVAGDRLLTARGDVTDVVWLGRQHVDTRLVLPSRVYPICISAGTLGNGRDLFVSPDHGIALDGYLINAGALVNGETIYQVAQMPLTGFTYFHVETEAHQLLLAEGVAAESYLDIPARAAFDNGQERAGAAPITPMSLPRISSARLVPAVLRDRLAPARAA